MDPSLCIRSGLVTIAPDRMLNPPTLNAFSSCLRWHNRHRPPLSAFTSKLAAVGGPSGEAHTGPLKCLQRCLHKAQEDYDGEYTRLIDLARATVVFPDVRSLTGGLRWLLHGAADAAADEQWSASFIPKRVKDRVSLQWDAEAERWQPGRVGAGRALLG